MLLATKENKEEKITEEVRGTYEASGWTIHELKDGKIKTVYDPKGDATAAASANGKLGNEVKKNKELQAKLDEADKVQAEKDAHIAELEAKIAATNAENK